MLQLNAVPRNRLALLLVSGLMMQTSSSLSTGVLLIGVPHIVGRLGQSEARRLLGRHFSVAERGK